jgi:hypothetical protein
VGLLSGLPLPAVTVQPWARQLAGLSGRSQACSRRHRRLLTAITIIGITATTITDTTRVTAEDITPHGARRGPPRQTRPRVTERRASFLWPRPRTTRRDGVCGWRYLAGSLSACSRHRSCCTRRPRMSQCHRIRPPLHVLSPPNPRPSYLLLTLYDVLALRHIGRTLPYRGVALASFTGYAFSHTLGFGSLIAPRSLVRTRLTAGGRWIRTFGSAPNPLPFPRQQTRLPCWREWIRTSGS